MDHHVQKLMKVSILRSCHSLLLMVEIIRMNQEEEDEEEVLPIGFDPENFIAIY